MNPRGTVGRRWGVVRAWGRALAWAVAVAVAAAGAARAQAPMPEPSPPPAGAGAGPAAGADGVRHAGDLSTRYRFIERYAVEAGKAKPRELVEYRVASRDVHRLVTDKPQGAPDRREVTFQVIYTERPAQVNGSGAVTDAVRRYDALRVAPMPAGAKPSDPKPLDGLTVWYKARPGSSPLVMGLTPGHPLSETEYIITGRQLVFLPDLSGVLPSLPSRVGDRWRVPRSAAQVLLGDRPMPGGDPLVATLQEVRKSDSGADLVAVIAVTGHAELPDQRDHQLNAQVRFTFAPPEAAAPAPAAGSPPQPSAATAVSREAAGAVDARGAITELRLARSFRDAVPGSNGRLRRTSTWEVTLQRQAAAAGAAPLSVPTPPPVPTEANSWLTYVAPQGRFHFRHPQDLLPDPNLPPSEEFVNLVDRAPDGSPNRVFSLQLQSKTGDSQADRDGRDPEYHRKMLTDEWAKERQEVLRGPIGWLPEAEWSPFKMKVYRIEAALKLDGSAPRPKAKAAERIFYDYYLVLLTRNESLVVTATTPQDPPLPYRKLVEEVIKSFKLGPPARGS